MFFLNLPSLLYVRNVKYEMQLSINLRGRQGTFVSILFYSKRSVLSLIVILFFLRKYRNNVLFPKIVKSAFLVLFYVCAEIQVV